MPSCRSTVTLDGSVHAKMEKERWMFFYFVVETLVGLTFFFFFYNRIRELGHKMYKHKHCLWFTVDIFLNWEGSRVQRLVQGFLTGPWLSAFTCSWHSNSDNLMETVIHLRFEIIFNLHFCVQRNSNWRKQNDHCPVISFKNKVFVFYLCVTVTAGRQTGCHDARQANLAAPICFESDLSQTCCFYRLDSVGLTQISCLTRHCIDCRF